MAEKLNGQPRRARSWLTRTAVLALGLSPLVYPTAGVLVVARQGGRLTLTALTQVLQDAHIIDLVVFSGAPLIEAAVGIWLFSLGLERRTAIEQRARLYASFWSLAVVVALSLFAAEEALAAPVLRLPGASTASLAFVSLPTLGAFVFMLSFAAIWSVTHAVAAVRNRRQHEQRT